MRKLCAMQTKTFTHGRIRQAVYDPTSQQLDLHWDNQSITAYKQVPAEVVRRLCAAPNPATYWEDRIAEEYPKGTPMKRPGASDHSGDAAAEKMRGLFADPT
jgi:hypothetical protein